MFSGQSEQLNQHGCGFLVSLHYRVVGSQIVVFGRTFEHKEALKALGARFNFADKSWSLANSAEGIQKIAGLCARVGGGQIGQLEVEPAKASIQSERPDADLVSTPNLQDARAASGLEGLSLRELVQNAQLALTQAFPSPVWVFGEIAGLSDKTSGIFLGLTESKDEKSAVHSIEIKATLWRSQLANIARRRGDAALKEILQEGLRVRVLVQVSMFADRGQLSLNILDIDPAFTKGALALAREQLLRELRAKGLDRKNKELPLGAFPFRVGLVTADGSRAYSDFVDQLMQGGFCGEVIFCASQMQGEKTAEDVMRAIRRLEENDCDLIVITRGGGSAADLRWFDAKDLAYAVAHSKLPILAAIGHHEDTCIVEEICFRREKTPTAAAEFILQIFRQTKERLRLSILAIDDRVRQKVELETSRWQRLIQLLDNRVLNSWQRRLQILQLLRERANQSLNLVVRQLDMRCISASSALERSALQHLMRRQNRLKEVAANIREQVNERFYGLVRSLDQLERKLIGIDPMPWLNRGWTQLRVGVENLSSIDQVKAGEMVQARLKDGVLRMKIEEIEQRTKRENIQ
jgi:exodeoxyribonuclease VII large subunit